LCVQATVRVQQDGGSTGGEEGGGAEHGAWLVTGSVQAQGRWG